MLTLIFFIVFKHARLVMPFIGLFQILCLRFPDKILYMFLLSYKSRGLKSFINCDSLHWDMAKITDFQNYFICFAFAFFVCFFKISDALGEACGTLLSVQLYCPSGYHCCDTGLSTCCATGYFCAGTVCISIAAIIVPIIIVIVIIVVIVVIIVKKKNAQPGTVIHPGQPQVQVANYPSPGYGQGPAPYWRILESHEVHPM